MVNKKRKVEFPFMDDDFRFEADDRVLYSNDELLTKRKDNRVESNYDLRESNRVSRSSGTSQYQTKKIFEPTQQATVKPRVDYSPKRDTKSYQAPDRPKEYVYPTERKDVPSKGQGLEKRPLGEKKVKVEVNQDKAPKAKRDFDLLAQKSMPINQTKEIDQENDVADKDYFAQKRNSLFETGNY